MKTKRQPIAPILNVFLLSLLLLTSQTALLAEPLGGQASPKSDSKASIEQTLAQFNRAFDALEAAYKEIPRDTFDPEAALELAGLDVKDVFHWVRDNTYFVPYRGALRGPVGVLMDRTGNSLDRALLLNEFLRLLGYQTRLARAQLAEAQAEDLLAKVRPIPPQGAMRPAQASEDPRKGIERYAKEFGLDKDQLIAQLDKTTQEQARLRKLAAERVAEQTAFLLEKIGPPPQSAIEELHRQRIGKLQDHWWLQYQDGASWVSLDPTLPDAEPGRSLAEPTESRVVSSLGNLDESLLHSVRIKVVLECWREGGLHEEPLLESPQLHPSEVLGKPVTLQHIPVNWPADLNLLASENPQETLKTTALAQNRWAPALRIGSKFVLDRSYTSNCNIDDAAKALDATGKLRAAVGGKLGEAVAALRSGDQSKETAATALPRAGQVTAQWIEYKLFIPGQGVQVERRQIFDLIGPASRRNGLQDTPNLNQHQQLDWRMNLLGQTEILALGSDLSSELVDSVVFRNGIDNLVNLHRLKRQVTDSGEHDLLAQTLRRFEVVPSSLYAVALARQVWRQKPHAVFFDQINLLSRHQQIRLSEADDVNLVDAVDIVVNRVASHADRDVNNFTEVMTQGVLDTNAEFMVARMVAERRPTPDLFTEAGNPGAAMAATSGRWQDWMVLRNRSDLERAKGDLSEDLRAQIETAIEAGRIVVYLPGPGGSARAGWWAVNPITGEALGRSVQGWGAEFTEYAVTVTQIYLNAGLAYMQGWSCVGTSGASAYMCWGCVLVGFAFAATGAVIGLTSAAVYAGAAIGSVWSSMTGAACTVVGDLAK